MRQWTSLGRNGISFALKLFLTCSVSLKLVWFARGTLLHLTASIAPLLQTIFIVHAVCISFSKLQHRSDQLSHLRPSSKVAMKSRILQRFLTAVKCFAKIDPSVVANVLWINFHFSCLQHFLIHCHILKHFSVRPFFPKVAFSSNHIFRLKSFPLQLFPLPSNDTWINIIPFILNHFSQEFSR